MGLILPHAPQFSLHENNLAATPSPTQAGTAVNHYASGPHVKNTSFTQLIASTAFDCQLIVVTVTENSSSNADSSSLLDIAIGAASSETVIIPDLLAGFLPISSSGFRSYVFPLYIPAGSRLSGRTQSILTTGSVRVFVHLYGGPRNPDAWWCGQQVTAYGVNAANSAGTKITPGDTGAEGTGVSMGTTSSNHECLVLGVQGHPDDVSHTARGYYFDVGIDSSSTEWSEADRFYAITNTTEQIWQIGIWWPIYRPIPSGTELMVRAECSSTNDALSAALYGVS